MFDIKIEVKLNEKLQRRVDKINASNKAVKLNVYYRQITTEIEDRIDYRKACIEGNGNRPIDRDIRDLDRIELLVDLGQEVIRIRKEIIEYI